MPLALIAALVAVQPPVEPVNGALPVAMTVSAARPVEPLSRLYLLPDYRESYQGNQVQQFLRCFMEQTVTYSQKEEEKRTKLLELPITDPQVAAEAGYLGRYVDRDLADAARMTHADWQLHDLMRRDGFGTLLPDVQNMRRLAQVLKVRARGEVAAGKHAAAVKTLSTLFALARMFEQHPTFIGHLVGIAIGTVACDVMEELVQSPGCPNLYWSLTNLPAPFLDTRLAMQGERLLLGTDFRRLVTGPRPLSDAEVYAAIGRVDTLVQYEPSRGEDVTAVPRIRYALRAVDEAAVAADRALLTRTGVDAGLAAGMSDLQAVVAADVQRLEVALDEMLCWFPLPAAVALPGMQAIDVSVKKLRSDGALLAPLVLPASQKVRQALARIDQRVAVLRVVEAVRLHAAEAGAFPATLDAVKVPVPADPVTGKPFSYAVKDGVVTLSGANPSPGNPATNRVYTVTLRK